MSAPDSQRLPPSSRPPSSWLARLRATSRASLGEEGRALLQRRVALMGKVSTAIMVGAVVLEVALAGSLRVLGQTSTQLKALSIAFPLALWLLCGRGELSARAVRIIEAVSLLGFYLCILVMGRFLHTELLRPGARLLQTTLDPGPVLSVTEQYLSTSVALALSYAAVLRAALIPSRPRDTLLLTAFLGIPVALIWLPDAAHFGAPHLTLMTRQYVSSGAVLNAAVWWGFTTVVATVIATVIYGLHREVVAAKRLGQYTLERQLGQGGMGTVYRARHAMMQRPTAIKLLSPEHTNEEQIERFEREVQLTTQLTHPNTITIFDYGRTAEGEFYYVMELLDGATLDEMVAVDGALPPERVVHVLAQVAGALVEAHAFGLIHRDIKPSNIILSTRGGRPDVAKLLDFGLVKQVTTTDSAELTQERTLTGTPLTMPPEAITAPKTVDARSDLYSLGAVGYFLLTGEHVFDGETMVEICSHHLHSVPVAPSDRLGRHVPEDLETLLLDCLAKAPAERPASAETFLERLSACDAFGRWTEARAREWWEEHQAALVKLRGRPQRLGARTVNKRLS